MSPPRRVTRRVGASGVQTRRDLACPSATTLAGIEKATRRLAAIRGNAGSITRAAAQLAMSHAALSEWVARRTLPE